MARTPNDRTDRDASERPFAGATPPDLIDRLRGYVHSRHAASDVFQRDPRTVAAALPHLERWIRWFRPELRGLERLPAEGPCLVVGNHSGGLYTPEAYVLLTSIVRHLGPERPVYLLAHDLIFAVPWFGPTLRRVGGIPAHHEFAERALDEGALVIVFPGGDYEAFRPFWDRGRVDFGGRSGFVRLALRKNVPILPAVSYGSHESTFVIARGDRLARALRLDRLRVKIFPWVLGLPWGIVPGFVPVAPWPSKITVQFGEMITPDSLGPDLPGEERVAFASGKIVGAMQAELDALVAAEPYPLFAPRRAPKP